MVYIKKLVALLICVLFIPTSFFGFTFAEDVKHPLELEMPEVVDGLRAFNMSVTVNDQMIRSQANHFEVEYPDALYNISGWERWTSFPHSTDKVVLTRINYAGQDKLDLTMKKSYPGTNDVPVGGKLSWIMFSLFRVEFLGKQNQYDDNPSKTYGYPEEQIVHRFENNEYHYFRRQVLASVNTTYNIAPLLYIIDLPAGWKGNQDPLDYDEAYWRYENQGTLTYESYILGVQEYSMQRYVANIKWNPTYKGFDAWWNWSYNYHLSSGSPKGTPTPLDEQLTDRLGAELGYYATQTSSQEIYAGNPIVFLDSYTARIVSVIWSTKYNYTITFTGYHAAYAQRGKGLEAAQNAAAEMLHILNSLRLDHDLSNVKPVTKTYTGGGSGINLAIVPVSLTDAPITHNKAYFEDVAAKVASYFNEVSYGTLIVDVKVIDVDGAWATIPKSKANYNAGNKMTFMNDAINAVDEKLDFTSYDYDSPNGIGVAVFYTEPNLFNDGAFAYSNSQGGLFETKDSVKVDAIYQFQQRLEPEAGVTKMARSLCHEFGHVLGKLLVTYNEGSSKDTWWLLPDEYLIGNVKCFQSLMGNLDSLKVERVHPSSYIKEWLGWLNYVDAPVNSTLTLTALDKMSYGDQVYKVSFEVPGSLSSYYILEYRNALTSSTWDNQYSHPGTPAIRKEVVIYKVTVPNSGTQKSNLNWVWTMFEWNGVLNVTSNTFKDPLNKIEFKPVVLGDNEATVIYSNYMPINLVGGVANPILNPTLPEVEYDYRVFTLPDTDLHAYTSDGRHIGVNYSTGVYENQVAGAITSGDLIGGTEWIFVPSDITVSFHVSSRDTETYLKELPEAKTVTNGDTTYNIQVIKYDSSGSPIKSSVKTETIKPGAEVEHTYSVNQNSINVLSKPVLMKTTITAQTLKQEIMESDSITISGVITPKLSSVKITLTYTKPDNNKVTRYVNTDNSGSYSDSYTPGVVGSWSVTASWEGNEAYEASTSNQAAFSIKKAEQAGGIPGYPYEATLLAIALFVTIQFIKKDH